MYNKRTMTTHVCIKPQCGATYEDSDPDPYYCPSCVIEKKALAAKIDASLASRPKRPVLSDLQRYDQAQKIRGFVNANTFL